MTAPTTTDPTAASPVKDVRPEIAALEQQLSRLFTVAAGMMRDRAAAVHPELSPGSYKVLATLVRSGPLHAGALAAMLYVDKSVISRITKQLAGLGFIERRPDPTDGRAHYLAATGEATRRVDQVRDEQREELHHFLADWRAEDIVELTTLLGRLNGAEAS